MSDEIWAQVLEELADCVPCEPCEPHTCKYAELCEFMRDYVKPSEVE